MRTIKGYIVSSIYISNLGLWLVFRYFETSTIPDKLVIKLLNVMLTARLRRRQNFTWEAKLFS